MSLIFFNLILLLFFNSIDCSEHNPHYQDLINKIFTNQKDKKTNLFNQLRNRQHGIYDNYITKNKNSLLYKILPEKEEKLLYDKNILTFSNTGKYLAVQFYNEQYKQYGIKIYNSITGICSKNFENIDEFGFLDISFSHDDKYVLINTRRNIILYDFSQNLIQIIFEKDCLYLAGFIKDNVFCISETDKIEIYDLISKEYKADRYDINFNNWCYYLKKKYQIVDENNIIIFPCNDEKQYIVKINIENKKIERLELVIDQTYQLSYLTNDHEFLILITQNIKNCELTVTVIDIHNWKIIQNKNYNIFERRQIDQINLMKYPNIISCSVDKNTDFFDLNGFKKIGYIFNANKFILFSKKINKNIIAAFLDINGGIYVWLLNDLNLSIDPWQLTKWMDFQVNNNHDGEILNENF